MNRLSIGLAAFALILFGWSTTTFAQGAPGECDPDFGSCGTPDKSGGGGGGGGGSILVDQTDYGKTYQYSDDYDSDGVEDGYDNCPRAANLDQIDGDGDGVGDACDNCLGTMNKEQLNLDGDKDGNACDPDIDGDGIANDKDNCKMVPNPPTSGSTQPDIDGDGIGDACDDDMDGDGKPNIDDPCPGNAKVSNPNNSNVTCFPDRDQDGTQDVEDLCPGIFNRKQLDMDGDGRGNKCDPDIDGDNFQNPRDNCPMTANSQQLDPDRDGTGQACDSNFCYVVMGDEKNCLDPEGSLTAYSPDIIGDTGEKLRLRLFANRRNQPMRYHWTMKSAPEGSQALLKNRKGTVTVSTPFEYRYLEKEAPTFVPDKPGEYTFQVEVETIWEDRVSKNLEETATYESTITAKGEPVEVHKQAGGCSVSADDRPLTGGLWVMLVALLGWLVPRRKKQ